MHRRSRVLAPLLTIGVLLLAACGTSGTASDAGSTKAIDERATTASPATAGSGTTVAAGTTCDAGLLWDAARIALGIDPSDPGYEHGATPGVPSRKCSGDWAKGCASRPTTGCTDIVDLWHWTNGRWSYVGDIGIPPASCLMRDKGVSDAAIKELATLDPLMDANLCAYPPPAEVIALIAQEEELDGRCRRTSNDLQACDERTPVYQQIQAQGWCYDDGNVIVAAWHWHRCGDSSEPIDWDRYNAWAPGH